jgi:sulfate/thiosulfate transport system permease protein
LIAFGTALLNGVLGTFAAYVLSKYRIPWARSRSTSWSTCPSPFRPSSSVPRYSLLWGPIGLLGKFLDPLGIQPMFTPAGVLLAHLFVTFPYMLGAVKPVLDELEVTYEEAAYTIGANRWQTFRSHHPAGPAWGALLGHCC